MVTSEDVRVLNDSKKPPEESGGFNDVLLITKLLCPVIYTVIG